MPSPILRALRSLLATAAIALSCASCAMVVAGPSQSTACSWTNPEATQQQGPAVSTDTVVLVDLTASFWPKAGQQPSLPDDPVSTAVSALLRNFIGSGTRLVSFGTFDGSSTTVDWKLSQVPLPTPTGDDSSMQNQQRTASGCLTSVVKSAVNSAPTTPGTDVMAALAAAGQQVQNVPASAVQVVVITDGLSNTGCLNLSSVLTNGQSAATVAKSCTDNSLAALKGVNLQLDGIGFQAAQPLLNSAQQAWVQKYWGDMCVALQVSAAASCVHSAGDSTPRLAAGSRLSDPAIRWPIVNATQPSLEAPADLLFAFDSAVLSDSGQAYLGLLAGELKQPGRRISKVYGYTDAGGSDAYNQGLSQQRAEAVTRYLAAHGFPGVPPVGMGKSDPVCSPQYTASGAAIPSCMAKDRRVQIILGG